MLLAEPLLLVLPTARLVPIGARSCYLLTTMPDRWPCSVQVLLSVLHFVHCSPWVGYLVSKVEDSSQAAMGAILLHSSP